MGEKSVEKWQKSWSDYKCSLKKKAAEINKLRNQTGSGPPCDKQLTEIEIKILGILGESFYKGCETKEFGLQLQEPDKKRCISENAQEASTSAVDHDYLASTPRPKRQKTDGLSKTYCDTLAILKSMDTKLSGIDNSLSSIASSMAIIASVLTKK